MVGVEKAQRGLSSVGDSLLSGNSQPVSLQETHNHSETAATVNTGLPSQMVCIGSKTFHNLIMHIINSKVPPENVHSAQPYEKKNSSKATDTSSSTTFFDGFYTTK